MAQLKKALIYSELLAVRVGRVLKKIHDGFLRYTIIDGTPMYRQIMGLMLFSALTIANASTGGVPADFNTFRYPVSISHESGTYPPFCMGAQITPQAMVTAAHCMKSPYASRNPLYVHRSKSSVEPAASQIKDAAIHPFYGTTGDFPADPNDVAMLKIRSNFPAGNLHYEANFDPYAYLKKQRDQIVVDDLGFNRTAGEIYTGKSTVITGDKCVEKIIDLSTLEWDHLSDKEKYSLDNLRLQLSEAPKSAFCSFVKKTDSFQHETGDSGAPLVFPVEGKATLAGVLASIVPLPSTRQYSMISLYINIAKNRNFINKCMAKNLVTRDQRMAEPAPNLASDPCEYRHVFDSRASLTMLLLE